MIGCVAVDYFSWGYILFLNLGVNFWMVIKDVMDLYKFYMVNY